MMFWSCTRVPSASTVVSPCAATGNSNALPISASRRFAGERAEGVVGVSDAALRVAAHDHVALRFQQAARALFRLAQFPIAVGQFLDARVQRAHFFDHHAPARQQEGDDRAGGGKQRAGAGGIGVWIVDSCCMRMPVMKPSAAETIDSVVMAARPNSTKAALLRARVRTASATDAPDLLCMVPARLLKAHAFGAGNLAILFPARGWPARALQRGKKTVKSGCLLRLRPQAARRTSSASAR